MAMSNSTLEGDLQALRAEVRLLQDRQEIAELIALHPVTVDGGQWPFEQLSIYTEDGVFNFCPAESAPPSPEPVRPTAADMVDVRVQDLVKRGSMGDALAGARMRGLTHFAGPAQILLSGDEALAFSYLLILERDPKAEPLNVPPHGITRGWRTLGASVNLWECVRGPLGWRVSRRSLRRVGSEESAKVFRRFLDARAAPLHVGAASN
jgi:hypothetical protein